jgi:ribosomal protein S21
VIEIEIHNNDIEKGIWELKKKVSFSGLLEDFKRHQYFIGPSERRREKDRISLKRKKRRLKRIRRADPDKKIWRPWLSRQKSELWNEFLIRENR